MSPRYMLDTNTVSHIIKRHPQVIQHLLAVPMHTVCISAITAGELSFGLAKRPEAVALKAAVTEFLRRVEVLPWDVAWPTPTAPFAHSCKAWAHHWQRWTPKLQPMHCMPKPLW